jgi:iron complex transport system substrate-binding protein
VVGVSSFDHYPKEVETRTRVGALIDPDFERIISLTPDLVVVYGSQADLIAKLDRAHLPMFRYRHAGLADVTQTMRELGARVGLSGTADDMARRVEGQLESVRITSRTMPHPRTALIIGRDAGALRGLFASGGIGFMHDMLETAGGADAFGDVKRENVQASTELLIARAPEVILEVRPDEHWTPERLQSEANLWKQLTSLPAVRDDRIRILTDDKLLVPGPRVGEAVALMARAIH